MDTQIDIILQGGQFKKLLEEQSVELREKYDMKEQNWRYYTSCQNAEHIIPLRISTIS